MKFWAFIRNELEAGEHLMLMVVVDLKGSTPGRRGFKMAVSGRGALAGSVGGGTMEYNMVNLARDLIVRKEFDPQVIRQVHNPDAGEDSSGLLCSGLQINLLYPLGKAHLEVVNGIIDTLENEKSGVLEISAGFMGFDAKKVSDSFVNWNYKSADEWTYVEAIGVKPVLYIFGGGHLSLALSKVFNMLGFIVMVYDERSDLNTMQENAFANIKKIIDYREAADHVKEGGNAYVAIMTQSHIADKMILEQMLSKNLKYLGMIGSKRKVGSIFDALKANGASADKLAGVDSPMGMDINSQTVEEIAISIAAKVIKVKNDNKSY